MGLSQSLLMDEAEDSKILMRQQETRGLVPFESHYIHYYYTRPDGSVFDSLTRQRLIMR